MELVFRDTLAHSTRAGNSTLDHLQQTVDVVCTCLKTQKSAFTLHIIVSLIAFVSTYQTTSDA